MGSCIWISDTHLNYISRFDLINFLLELEEQKADCIFLTGDVSTGPLLIKHLSYMEKVVNIPIYFVIGNHDLHRSSFEIINKSLIELTQKNNNLIYLTNSEPIYLNEQVALIGDDGFCDARWGEPFFPLVFLLDFYLIKDFRSLFGSKERYSFMRDRAQIAAENISSKLQKALKTHDQVIILTHFPPWPEKNNKWFGLIDEFWAPYNSSKVMAQTIENIMIDYPDKKLTIYSGHTHVKRHCFITPNIELKVAGVGNKPKIQEIIKI